MYRSIVSGVVLMLIAGVAWAQKSIYVPFKNSPEEVRYVEDAFVVNLSVSTGQIKVALEVAAATGKFGIAQLDGLREKYRISSVKPLFPGAMLRPRKEGAPDLSRYYVVEFNPDAATLAEALAEFSQSVHVEHVEPIGIHPIYLTPNDPFFQNPPPSFPYPQWHLEAATDADIDATAAWDTETGDPSVVVGILDTGLRYIHGDLGGSDPPGPNDNVTNGNVWVNPGETPGDGVDDDGNGFIDDVIGWDFVNTHPSNKCASNKGEDCIDPDNDPSDFNGHGTHVGGIVSAITNNAYSGAGVAGGFGGSPANGVKLMPLRIGWHGKDGFGYVRMDFAAQAINYAVDQKLLRGQNVV
ncbi:S8 family serine peptidase, partial [candidate division TA06 bacterium]|nr:S8 family serine peptidase [candidate division TA06 bacterium]